MQLSGHFELGDSVEEDDIKLKCEEGRGHSVVGIIYLKISI